MKRWVAWGFERLYREFAWAYDGVASAVSADLWREWTLASLPYLRGDLLELGFGTGHVQRALAQSWPNLVVGLDASPQMVHQTRRRALSRKLTVNLIHGTALALPFPAKRFDTVLATFPTPYIADPQTLANIRRVLRADGRLIIVDSTRFTRATVLTKGIEAVYRVVYGRRGAVSAEIDQEDPRPLSHYHAFLPAAGFQLRIERVAVKQSELTVYIAELIS